MSKKYGLIALLCINYTYTAQSLESLDTQEKSIMRDLRLIDKCYLSKAVCNTNEQALAHDALRGVSIKAGLIITGIALGKFIHYKYRQALAHPGIQKETASERFRKEKVLKKVAQEGLTQKAVKGAQRPLTIEDID